MNKVKFPIFFRFKQTPIKTPSATSKVKYDQELLDQKEYSNAFFKIIMPVGIWPV